MVTSCDVVQVWYVVQTICAYQSNLPPPAAPGSRPLLLVTCTTSVLNHLPGTVLVNASLSAKLQSPSARVELDDMRMERGASVAKQNPAPALRPSENLDMIVEHTLEELGTHTLRVSDFVSFTVVLLCVLFGNSQQCVPRESRRKKFSGGLNKNDHRHRTVRRKDTSKVGAGARRKSMLGCVIREHDRSATCYAEGARHFSVAPPTQQSTRKS